MGEAETDAPGVARSTHRCGLPGGPSGLPGGTAGGAGVPGGTAGIAGVARRWRSRSSSSASRRRSRSSSSPRAAAGRGVTVGGATPGATALVGVTVGVPTTVAVGVTPGVTASVPGGRACPGGAVVPVPVQAVTTMDSPSSIALPNQTLHACQLAMPESLRVL